MQLFVLCWQYFFIFFSSFLHIICLGYLCSLSHSYYSSPASLNYHRHLDFIYVYPKLFSIRTQLFRFLSRLSRRSGRFFLKFSHFLKHLFVASTVPRHNPVPQKHRRSPSSNYILHRFKIMGISSLEVSLFSSFTNPGPWIYSKILLFIDVRRLHFKQAVLYYFFKNN